MSARIGFAIAALAAVTLPGVAAARGLSVEIRTDRGADAVYQSGENIQVSARTSNDAYLLVYEIDTEGGVHILFPSRGEDPRVEANRSLKLPNQDEEWVVEGPVGEGYIVAVASNEPFQPMPWYLRPYNAQANDIGYFGGGDQATDDEEGVTAEGKIVGDPFVAMERIRRRVLADPDDAGTFATAYTSYYLHQEVRYPRYLCYDCHRPGHWSWWDGFDPYYSTCSVFDLRVNWNWGWGPSYWFGRVPYFVYVYRPTCPPYYRHWYRSGQWYGSWHGWGTWHRLWGAHLVRYKTAPPPGYVGPGAGAPGANRRWKGDRPQPPGFLTTRVPREPVVGVLPLRRLQDRNRPAAPGVRDLRDRRSVRTPRSQGTLREPQRVPRNNGSPRVITPRNRSTPPSQRTPRNNYIVPRRDAGIRPAPRNNVSQPRQWRTPQAQPQRRQETRESRSNGRSRAAPEARQSRSRNESRSLNARPSRPRSQPRNLNARPSRSGAERASGRQGRRSRR